ncbi:MAG: DUF3108 domain-containing protein [Bacteroidales bacterium]|nr:DUF3108 domain-containing protein [Bacteroidales bacterium]
MFHHRLFFLFVLVIGHGSGLFLTDTASGQCPFQNVVFTSGEEISYTVSYNWGPIWVDAGTVTFKTTLEQKEGKPVWHFVSTGRTFASYDFLFKVRDTYESWIDTATFQTIEFNRYIYEGGYQLQNRSWFDYIHRVVYSHTKRNDDPMVHDTLHMIDCTFDMLAAVYYVRSLDPDSIQQDITLPVFVAIDDSVYRIDVRLLGKEIVEHPSGKHFPCIKFSATMVEGTIFTKDQEAFVWVSDDPNRIPVFIEAKILVGSVNAYLNEAKGLKEPIRKVVSAE